MSKSKAHKYWNKFRGWARHFGAVRAEESPALEEFFINPDRIPAESPQLVTGIFSDWFLMDRKLTHCRLTPLELFIQTHERERKLKEPDLSVYRTFQRTNRFGIFRVGNCFSDCNVRYPGDCADVSGFNFLNFNSAQS